MTCSVLRLLTSFTPLYFSKNAGNSVERSNCLSLFIVSIIFCRSSKNTWDPPTSPSTVYLLLWRYFPVLVCQNCVINSDAIYYIKYLLKTPLNTPTFFDHDCFCDLHRILLLTVCPTLSSSILHHSMGGRSTLLEKRHFCEFVSVV